MSWVVLLRSPHLTLAAPQCVCPNDALKEGGRENLPQEGRGRPVLHADNPGGPWPPIHHPGAPEQEKGDMST